MNVLEDRKQTRRKLKTYALEILTLERGTRAHNPIMAHPSRKICHCLFRISEKESMTLHSSQDSGPFSAVTRARPLSMLYSLPFLRSQQTVTRVG